MDKEERIKRLHVINNGHIRARVLLEISDLIKSQYPDLDIDPSKLFVDDTYDVLNTFIKIVYDIIRADNPNMDNVIRNHIEAKVRSTEKRIKNKVGQAHLNIVKPGK